MQTPFTYADSEKQSKNQKGHDAQDVVFSAYAAGEDMPGGVCFKYDEKRDLFGNWAIEFLDNKGIPSGIARTQCEFWHSISPWDSIFLRVSRLKKYIEVNKPDAKRSNEGSMNYIIPADKLRKWLEENYSIARR